MRKRQKGSKNHSRLVQARKDMWNKASNQHVSFQRSLADALCESKVDCIVIGKGHIRLGLAQSENGTGDQHFGAQNTGYLFRLLIFIKEKAAERDIKIIEVPDPKRVGNIEDHETKWHATHAMLDLVSIKTGIPNSSKRIHKGFQFSSSKDSKVV